MLEDQETLYIVKKITTTTTTTTTKPHKPMRHKY